MQESLKNSHKNYFEKYLGFGWYPVEFLNEVPFVWSKKEAILNFPENKEGYFLTLSADPMNKTGRVVLVKIFDEKKRPLIKEFFSAPLKTIKISKNLKKIKIIVCEKRKPDRLQKKFYDKKELGICLWRLEDAKFFDEKNEWKNKLLSEICPWSPQVLEIETTTRCNMAPPCVMCNRNARLKKHESDMPTILLRRIKKNLKGVHAVCLHGTGEPLLDKRIFSLIDALGREVYTRFNTNGLLLNKKNCLKVIKKKLKEINVSLDSATPETYQKIRGPHFFKVINNIKQLITLKKKFRSKFPEVIINLALMKVNINEVPDFPELAKKLGIKKIYFKLLSPTSNFYSVKREKFVFNYEEQFLDTKSEEFKVNIRKAYEKCQKYKIELISPDKEVWDAIEK